MKSAGKLPDAIELGKKTVRWSVDDIRAWIQAGCPRRDEWKSLRNVHA